CFLLREGSYGDVEPDLFFLRNTTRRTLPRWSVRLRRASVGLSFRRPRPPCISIRLPATPRLLSHDAFQHIPPPRSGRALRHLSSAAGARPRSWFQDHDLPVLPRSV